MYHLNLVLFQIQMVMPYKWGKLDRCQVDIVNKTSKIVKYFPQPVLM